MTSKVYDIVTEQILEMLEEGTVPWRKPWKTYGIPMNLVSKKAYRGINPFLLTFAPFDSPYWLTYNQAKQLGGEVRKGEKGQMVVFWKMWQKNDDSNIPVLRYYTVFNTEQCDLPEGKVPNFREERVVSPIEEAERIVAGFKNCPKINFGGDRACYSPIKDIISVPSIESFDTAEHHYATLFHEMAHSTGHKSRLNRKGIAEFDMFGSHQYSQEELVAEFSSAFLCAECGIGKPVIENTVSYIGHWQERLRDKDNKKMIVQAAAQAQKASDLILGVKFEKEKEANA